MPTIRHQAGDAALHEILELIQTSFAYMDDRIDPPSSMHKLTMESISSHCRAGEVWSMGSPPVACMFLKIKNNAMYLGKIAVSEKFRGKGLATHLVDIAEARARSLALPFLELETRIELTENRRTFEKLGFTKIREDAHAGFDRPTFIVMRKPVTGR